MRDTVLEAERRNGGGAKRNGKERLDKLHCCLVGVLYVDSWLSTDTNPVEDDLHKILTTTRLSSFNLGALAQAIRILVNIITSVVSNVYNIQTHEIDL